MPDTFVAWNDNFLVGNDIIDKQHRELVKMTNEFYANCQQGGFIAKVSFMEALKGAVHYVKTHFASEEEIMRKTDYPEYDAHKKQHDDFVAEVHRQSEIFENEDNPNPAKFVHFLLDWVLQHIADTDKKYVPYLAKLNR